MTKKEIILAVALLVFIAACGGDDSPSSPGGGSQVANIAGLWIGTGTTTSMSPSTNAVVQAMAPYLGQPGPISVAVTQSGANIALRVTDTGSGMYTDYAGTVGASSFSAQWTYSSMAAITGITCGDGIQRDLICTADNITGTVNGNSVSGTTSTSYNCQITSTHAAAGIVLANGTFSVTKSK